MPVLESTRRLGEFSLRRRARTSTPDTLRNEELTLAHENHNEDRKQRIRDAFQEGQPSALVG